LMFGCAALAACDAVARLARLAPLKDGLLMPSHDVWTQLDGTGKLAMLHEPIKGGCCEARDRTNLN
jgi:hypothetical protein